MLFEGCKPACEMVSHEVLIIIPQFLSCLLCTPPFSLWWCYWAQIIRSSIRLLPHRALGSPPTPGVHSFSLPVESSQKPCQRRASVPCSSAAWMPLCIWGLPWWPFTVLSPREQVRTVSTSKSTGYKGQNMQPRTEFIAITFMYRVTPRTIQFIKCLLCIHKAQL